MRHRIGYNRLGRKAAHRQAMLKNMATSLFMHERIRTTTAKAKEVRKLAEKLITRAKVDTVHNRRIASQSIGDKGVLAKLFVELGPRFETRPGGYTRVLKLGQRRGDGAEMAILELVEELEETTQRARKPEAPVEQSESEIAAPETDSTPDDVSAAEADNETTDEPEDSNNSNKTDKSLDEPADDSAE